MFDEYVCDTSTWASNLAINEFTHSPGFCVAISGVQIMPLRDRHIIIPLFSFMLRMRTILLYSFTVTLNILVLKTKWIQIVGRLVL